MFDIGFWELLFIMVLALLILGPERLPSVARTAGSWMGQARRMARNLRRELEREVALADLDRSDADAGTRSGDAGGSESAAETGTPAVNDGIASVSQGAPAPADDVSAPLTPSGEENSIAPDAEPVRKDD